MTLPAEIHTVAQVRLLEAAAIAAGTDGYTLMRRAGAAALAVLRQRWPGARSLAIVAGPGNNGGDGLVLACLARQEGLTVDVLQVGTPAERHEARQARAALAAVGIAPRDFDAASLGRADVVVDALLGIGLRTPLREEWNAAIRAINASSRPVLALDVPSGLDADTGCTPLAVRATATLTFLALKQGLYLGAGPEFAGEILFDALEIDRPAEIPAMRRLDSTCLAAALTPRPRQSHKALFGRVLVLGGGVGMPGAVRLAAEAALRVGAGLVTVASHPEHLMPVVGARPELMFRAVQAPGDVAAAIAEADVIAVGPGLGRDAWAEGVLSAVLSYRQARQRLVLDADALNLVAEGRVPRQVPDWILTPHPGEAARLLGIDTREVQHDRLAALAALCERRGGTIVLKGAATLIGRTGEPPRLCTRGNPGMAVPGMGDVLTGAMAGMLAQGGDVLDAVSAAVYAHAVAGDRCARAGVRGVVAQEVAQELRAVLAHLP